MTALIAVYLPSFRAPMVMDDITTLNSFNLQNLYDPGRIWQQGALRFVANISFSANIYTGGHNVLGFHLVNLAIHIIAGLGVYKLCKLLTQGTVGNKSFPLVSMAIFLLHPIQTQAVTYIVQRYTSLATLFYVWSLVSYIKFRLSGRLKFLGISLLIAIFGFFAKEIVYSLPLVLGLYELLWGKRIKQFIWLVPFVILALGIPLILGAVGLNLGSENKAIIDVPSGLHGTVIRREDYLLTQINVARTYLRLAVLPVMQNFDYDYPIKNSWDLETGVSLALHLALVGMALALSKKNRVVCFGILFFYFALIPESLVVVLKDVIYEHRMYLPMVGISVVGGQLLYASIKQFRKHTAWLSVGMLLLMLIATFKRNLVWADEITLWQDTVVKSPAKSRPRTGLAEAYTKHNLFDLAIKEYEKARQLDSDLEHAYLSNLGIIMLKAGQTEEAVDYFRMAIEKKNDDIHARNNLGGAYLSLGEVTLATTEFQQVLRVQPKNASAHKNLGIIYMQLGNDGMVIKEFEAAAWNNLEDEWSWTDLGDIYRQYKEVEKSIEAYEKAIYINPRADRAYFGLGKALLLKGDFLGSKRMVNKALKLDPENPEYVQGKVKLEGLSSN